MNVRFLREQDGPIERELKGKFEPLLRSARYYLPLWGRFLSRDPLEFSASTNFYEYANNNPVDFSDPTGAQPAPGGPGGFGAPGGGLGGVADYEGYGYASGPFPGEDPAPDFWGDAVLPQNFQMPSIAGGLGRGAAGQSLSEVQLTFRIYGETGGLRPQGGDVTVLHDARTQIGGVILNLSAAGHPERASELQPFHTDSAIATRELALCRAAARSAMANPNPAGTAQHFWIGLPGTRPPASDLPSNVQPLHAYGPFYNSDGGDVPHGPNIHVYIYP